LYGKEKSKIIKKNMSNGQKGKKFMHLNNIEIRVPEHLMVEKRKEGFKDGRSPQLKQKISKIMKNKYIPPWNKGLTKETDKRLIGKPKTKKEKELKLGN